MPFTFRKSKKIAGVRVNVGKRGVTSVSTGGKVLGTNIGKKGVSHRVSAPGTGLSFRSKASGCASVIALVMLGLTAARMVRVYRR